MLLLHTIKHEGPIVLASFYYSEMAILNSSNNIYTMSSSIFIKSVQTHFAMPNSPHLIVPICQIWLTLFRQTWDGIK